MEINERIFELLSKEGKTASSLAQYLNIKPSSITGWKNEGSYPSSKYIDKISEFLNVSVSYLVNGYDTSHNLTSDEQKLLNLFSQLDERGKGEVIGYINAKLNLL